jgi:predicted ATPase/DNA-binding winged helix-turn-helix (wHTH) protein
VIYGFADCEIDTDRLEIRRDGAPHPVEPQVFDLLVHLVRHRDRVVTRDELLARVWGHAFVSDATVNSRVKAARRAIGDDGASQSMIRTIRGRGYRFVAEVVDRAEGAGPAIAPARDVERPIGRARELAALNGLLDAALAGDRRLAVVTGEAGVGKTALVDGFVAEASTRGASLVAAGRCAEPHGPVEPYLPVLDALGGLARGGAGEPLLQTLSERAPTWLLQIPWLAGPDALEAARLRSLGAGPERMLREMVEALEALGARSPLLLVVEDLHWGDDATLSLLTRLAQRREPARMLVLATARRVPGHGSERLVRELAPRGRCVEIALAGWSVAAVCECLARRYPGLDGEVGVAEILHRRSDGNPLFVECLLRSWAERGAIAPDGGRWELQAALDEPAADVPESLRELIEQEVDALADEDQRVLEAASVAGSEFSAAALAGEAEPRTEEVEARCARLARLGLLRERPPADWPDGTVAAAFAFAHELYRQVLYERLPASRRARLHREVGARLERAYATTPGERAAELAGHFIHGRRPAAAVRHLCRSVQQATARGAPAQAVRDARTALELLEGHPEIPRDDGAELWLHAALAGALVTRSGFASAEAEHAIVRALRIARARDDEASAAPLLQGLAGLREYLGDHEASEALAGEALHAAGEAELAVEAHDLIACSLFHQGRFSAALEQAECALSRHDAGHRHVVLATLGEHPAVSSEGWAGLALWFMDDEERARARIDAALELAAHPTRRHSLAYARVLKARWHHMRGEASEARKHAEAGLALAREGGFAYHAAAGQIFLGWARALEGDGDGVDLIRAGLDAHRATGAGLDRPYFLALLAEAVWATRQPERALRAVDEALEILGDARAFFWEPELHRLRGALILDAYGAERSADAEAAVGRAIETARRQGAPALHRRADGSLVALHRTSG